LNAPVNFLLCLFDKNTQLFFLSTECPEKVEVKMENADLRRESSAFETGFSEQTVQQDQGNAPHKCHIRNQ